MIKTIIFDLAEVYLKGFIGVEHYLSPLLGVSTKKIYPKLLGKELTSLFHGEITEEQYWLMIIRKNNWNVDVNALKEAVRKNFEEIEGMREIIKKLKMRFKLGLLSVHAKEWVDYCNKKFDYHKLFHSTLYSFEVGIGKPEKRFYELIVKKLDSKPEECLFIDDQEGNLAPAKELGIKTIVFKNVKQLKGDLISLGLISS